MSVRSGEVVWQGPMVASQVSVQFVPNVVANGSIARAAAVMVRVPPCSQLPAGGIVAAASGGTTLAVLALRVPQPVNNKEGGTASRLARRKSRLRAAADGDRVGAESGVFIGHPSWSACTHAMP